MSQDKVYSLKKIWCAYKEHITKQEWQGLYEVLAMHDLICEATGYSAVSLKIKSLIPGWQIHFLLDTVQQTVAILIKVAFIFCKFHRENYARLECALTCSA